MDFFTEDDPELTKDVANAVSLDPNVVISNFNKRFKKEKNEWVYDKLNQRISLRTKKMRIGYKFQFILDTYLVLKS